MGSACLTGAGFPGSFPGSFITGVSGIAMTQGGLSDVSAPELPLSFHGAPPAPRALGWGRRERRARTRTEAGGSHLEFPLNTGCALHLELGIFRIEVPSSLGKKSVSDSYWLPMRITD